jgi:hypothetical protein
MAPGPEVDDQRRQHEERQDAETHQRQNSGGAAAEQTATFQVLLGSAERARLR